MKAFFESKLEAIINKGNLRTFLPQSHEGKYICVQDHRMLNLSSNDYLGIAGNTTLKEKFLRTIDIHTFLPSASSSRLLTGNFAIHEETENLLCKLFDRTGAIIFNSGYHANIGILPAITTQNSLILGDKLVHSSLIDGMRLSPAKKIRYRHNDYEQLEQIIEKSHMQHDLIVIVTESLFSMDGDYADLKRLCSLKKQYKNILLYVDEAHAFGTVGKQGLGYAEKSECIQDIDILVGTFGKTIASVGAFAVCDEYLKHFLINTSRSLIFSTALPPINIYWTHFILSQLSELNKEREQLQSLISEIKKKYCPTITSHIFPLICGTSDCAMATAKELQEIGYYALAVRPPTVPEGSARVRLSFSSDMQFNEIEPLLQIFYSNRKK